VRADPDPDAFEGWLLQRCHEAATSADDPARLETTGSVRAMALDILVECRLAQMSGSFRSWLDEGAPSDDTLRDG
jgi:hypothetical protein